MVLEWREREHEDMDQEALQDAPTVNVLRQSGLLKFYTSPMQLNFHLLRVFDKLLGSYLSMFDLQGEFIEVTLEDVYFISSLSWRGAPVNLEVTGKGGDLLSVQNT